MKSSGGMSLTGESSGASPSGVAPTVGSVGGLHGGSSLNRARFSRLRTVPGLTMTGDFLMCTVDGQVLL